MTQLDQIHLDQRKLSQYNPPQLRVYGSITQLTNNAGATMGSGDDNNEGKATKFSF
jgi:hypothetical protein